MFKTAQQPDTAFLRLHDALATIRQGARPETQLNVALSVANDQLRERLWEKLENDPRFHLSEQAQRNIYGRRAAWASENWPHLLRKYLFSQAHTPDSPLGQLFQLKKTVWVRPTRGGYYAIDSNEISAHPKSPFALLHELGHASIYHDPWKMRRMAALEKVLSPDRLKLLNERLANARVRRILRTNPDAVERILGTKLTPEQYQKAVNLMFETYQEAALRRATWAQQHGRYKPQDYDYITRHIMNIARDKNIPNMDIKAYTLRLLANRNKTSHLLNVFKHAVPLSLLFSLPVIQYFWKKRQKNKDVPSEGELVLNPAHSRRL